ncbi:MAG: hypothetical protein SXA11_11285 [Cyanobacteriota bacterium]|nr:hypothetical protein [Cyanobacteriota bacterium]
MIQQKQKISWAVLLSLLGIFSAGPARAYTFTKVAETNNYFSTFGRGLSEGIWPYGTRNEYIQPYQNGFSINENGEIAFLGNLNSGGQVLFRGDGARLTQVAETGGIFQDFAQGISINDSGDVAFLANLVAGLGSGIFVNDDISKDPKNAAVGNINQFGQGLSINNSGTVAYYQLEDIYTWSDANGKTNLTGCNGLVGTRPPGCAIIRQRPSINNGGTVAYSTTHGVLTSNGPTITDTNLFPAHWFMDPSINDLGRAVFHTHFYGSGRGIFTSNGTGDNDFIAGNTNPFTWIQSPSINKGGTVAFLADLPTGDRGIYTGHDLAAKVIGKGDILNGSLVTDLSVDRESINDKGQIAFWAKLANGTEGIFRADPEAGDSQFNPLLPDFTVGSLYKFRDEHRYKWFDPPSAYGFKYTMVEDSLFTSILNFPTGFDNPFTVVVGDTILGEFSPGESVDFVDLLGGGVKEFLVTGLDVDPADPTVFPIQLDFNTETASFDMLALVNKDSEDPAKTPEPGSVFGLLVFGAIASSTVRKRRHR